jgi:hypothetical protein
VIVNVESDKARKMKDEKRKRRSSKQDDFLKMQIEVGKARRH